LVYLLNSNFLIIQFINILLTFNIFYLDYLCEYTSYSNSREAVGIYK
jgi:hypothetical protein